MCGSEAGKASAPFATDVFPAYHCTEDEMAQNGATGYDPPLGTDNDL